MEKVLLIESTFLLKMAAKEILSLEIVFFFFLIISDVLSIGTYFNLRLTH